MNVERQDGMAAWWEKKRAHEPRLPGRHANMLSDLLAPDRANCEGDTFRERFREWEVTVQRYEVQSGETLTDSLRVAVVSGHSPQELQAALWSEITTIGWNYQRLRTFVNDFLTSGLEYNSVGLEQT